MISYIGGKYRISKWINLFIPKEGINSYGEIFGGAFWVYLKSDIFKRVEEVHYNDFNKLMVNMFECSRTPEKFYDHFKDIKSQDNELFNEYRDIIVNNPNVEKMPDFDLGYQYPYLLTQVFSGLGLKPKTKMQDLKGVYKSKFDSFRGRLVDEDFNQKLKKITKTHNLDFEERINLLDKEDSFLYLDPPYYSKEHYYSFHNFGKEDHLRLSNCLKNIKGKFCLSYYDFEELNDWFPKVELKYTEDKKGITVLNKEEVLKGLEEGKFVWARKDFVKSSAAKKGVNQKKGTEILIMNYPPFKV